MASSRLSRMRMEGSREASGFWKMICTRRWYARLPFRSRRAMSSPSKRMRPPEGLRTRVIMRERVVLPQPLLPTSPKVFPRSRAKLTRSTARTMWVRNTPLENVRLTSSSSSTLFIKEAPHLPARGQRDLPRRLPAAALHGPGAAGVEGAAGVLQPSGVRGWYGHHAPAGQGMDQAAP